MNQIPRCVVIILFIPFYDFRNLGGRVVAVAHGSAVAILGSTVLWALLSVIAAIGINVFYWPRFSRYKRGEPVKLNGVIEYRGGLTYEKARAWYLGMSIPIISVTVLTVGGSVVWAIGR